MGLLAEIIPCVILAVTVCLEIIFHVFHCIRYLQCARDPIAIRVVHLILNKVSVLYLNTNYVSYNNVFSSSLMWRDRLLYLCESIKIIMKIPPLRPTPQKHRWRPNFHYSHVAYLIKP